MLPMGSLLGFEMPRFRLLAAVSLLAVTAASPAFAINFSTIFSETGHSMWTSGQALVIDTGMKRIGPDPWNLGKVVGGFVNPCDPFGTCNTGAQLGAQTTGNMALEYALKFNSGSVDVSYPINVQLATPTPGSTLVGQTFSIGSSYSVAGYGAAPFKTAIGLGSVTARMQADSPTLQAIVNLDAQFHAFIGAQACVVGVCQGPFLAPPDIDKSQTLASVNWNNDGKLKLGEKEINLKENFSALDGDLTGRLNIPNINAVSSAANGSTATDLVSVGRDNVAALDANVGNIVSKAFGLPLVGDVGGIGYNLLSVNAGLALDVKQTLSLSLTPQMTLEFLSPVQQLLSSGQWSGLTNSITYDLGQSLTLRSPYRNVAVIPISSLKATLTNRTDLILEGDLSLQALGANAFGQQLGPLLDTGNLNAGLLDLPVFQNSFDLNFDSVTESPFTIGQAQASSFDPKGFQIRYLTPGEPGQSGQIYATDLDTTQCNPTQIAGGLCPDEQFITSTAAHAFDEQGQDVFIQDLGVFAQQGIIPGPNSGDDDLLALLAGVGYTPGLPEFNIPVGAPIPEPATWWLMIGGLGLAGGALRRRREAAPVR